MKKHTQSLLVLIAVFLPFSSHAEEKTIVVVDQEMEAYTLVIALPAQARQEIEEQKPGKFKYFSHSEFKDQAEEILSPRILSNSYSYQNFYQELALLVEKYPGTPIGVTWHGGIAITRNDYRHTEYMLKVWKSNPEKFFEIQNLPENIPRDPTNPRAHLVPLLHQAK